MNLLSRGEKSVFKGGEVSKARIAALLMSVGGLLLLAGQFLNGDLDIGTAFNNALPLLGGLGLYGLRDAVEN